MTAHDATLSPHPAPQPRRVTAFEAAFGLIAGPLAWIVQLDVDYGLASRPCIPKDERALQPAMIVGVLAAVTIGLAALLVSWRAYRATEASQTGAASTRFLALWGVLLGSGFALASGLALIALMLLPRCAA